MQLKLFFSISVCLTLTCILLISCSPTNLSACRETAAKSAKSDNALNVLLHECNVKFPVQKAPDKWIDKEIVNSGAMINIEQSKIQQA